MATERRIVRRREGRNQRRKNARASLFEDPNGNCDDMGRRLVVNLRKQNQ
jgi:hypothetical protein